MEPRSAPGRTVNRRVLLRVIGIVVVPLLLLSVAELAFRISGVGYSVALWSVDRDSGSVVDNAAFTWPEFGPDRARAVTAFRLDPEKPPGRRRVFVLGGSAAQGDPDPTFAFSRALEVLIRQAWPARTYEVVNVGITAVDSAVVRRVADDVLRLEPDVLVVYAGNNEFVGPSGLPMGEGGARRVGTVTRWMLSLRGPQTLQLGLAARSLASSWSGMEDYLAYEIAPSDDRVASIHERFERNLQAVAAAAVAHGVPVVLCTVPVNLADAPPFLTISDTPGRASISEALDATDSLLAQRRPEEALGHLDAALADRPAAADLVFARARVLEVLGRSDDAAEAFGSARDLDGLRFRATSAINRILRAVAEATPGVVLADVERAMELRSQRVVPGNDLFYDHVHLNFSGNVVAARAILSAMAGAADFAAWGPAAGSLSDAEIGRRLAFTGWSLREAGIDMEDRLQRAPFTGQRGHDRRLEQLRTDLERLSGWAGPDGIAATEQVMRRHLTNRPNDWIIRYALARLLVSGPGRTAEAIEELERVCADRPTFFPARQILGAAYLEAERPREAMAAFRVVLDSTPVSVRALTDCGIATLAAEDERAARRWFERALRRDPDHVDALYHLALAEIGLDGTSSSRARLLIERVLELDPDHKDAGRIHSALL